MQQFMNDRDLPNRLRQRVVQYIDFTYIKSKDTYSDDIGIPRSLELRVASCQYRAVIETCTVAGAPLRGCIEQFINTLLVSVREVRRASGTFLPPYIVPLRLLSNTVSSSTPRPISCQARSS